MDQVKDFNGRLNWVLAMAAIYLVAAGVECVCGLTSSSLLGPAVITPGAQFAGGLLAMLAGLGALVVLVAYVIAGIIFLILLYRACSQAASFSSPFKVCSPAMAVWYWFIPFANFVMPHQVMADLLRSSAESVGRRFDGMVVHLWWSAFLMHALYAVPMYFMSPRHPQTIAELSTAELWVGIGGALGFATAALFIWMMYSWRANYVQALQRLDATVPAEIAATAAGG